LKGTLSLILIQRNRCDRTANIAGADNKLHEELKRLKKENHQLTQERDILKKAAAYFAKESL
jgi:transposase-like protein